MAQSRLAMPKPLPPRILGSHLNRNLSRVFRVMKEDPELQLPRVGSTWACLGVRVPQDIAPNSASLVRPGNGGMSVVRDPDVLIGSLKPRSLGGEGLFPLWEIGTSLFPSTTQFGASQTAHVNIEPASEMTLDAFQTALGSTRSNWSKHA